MNTHDKYELPPLFLPGAIGKYTKKEMQDYARAAIEPYAKRIAELEAALIAYASEFAPDEDGEPDVGRIHENIRKLKADCKRRGEAALSPKDAEVLLAGMRRFSTQEERNAARKLIAALAAPQPAEPVKVPSESIDIEDVRQYLDSWGCLDHPGVRALLARYGSKS